MKVSCTYRDVATGQSVDVAGEEVAVKRPVAAPEAEPAVEQAGVQIKGVQTSMKAQNTWDVLIPFLTRI